MQLIAEGCGPLSLGFVCAKRKPSHFKTIFANTLKPTHLEYLKYHSCIDRTSLYYLLLFSGSPHLLFKEQHILRENDCSLLLYSLIAFYISVFKGMYFFSSALLCLYLTALSIFHRAQNCSHSYKNASAVWDLLRRNKKCTTWENAILDPAYWFHDHHLNRNC